jgi:hypothetical protein
VGGEEAIRKAVESGERPRVKVEKRGWLRENCTYTFAGSEISVHAVVRIRWAIANMSDRANTKLTNQVNGQALSRNAVRLDTNPAYFPHPSSGKDHFESLMRLLQVSAHYRF